MSETPTAALLPTPEELAEAAAAWTKAPAVSDDMIKAAAAALSYISTLPGPRLTTEGTWAPDTLLGAIMLTSRLERRRNSASGIESSTDLGVTYVARTDSDISRLLRIDGFAPPQVG